MPQSSVVDREDAKLAVANRRAVAAAVGRDVDTVHVGRDRSHRPPVRDDEDGSARMLFRDPANLREHAFCHRLVALPLLPAVAALVVARDAPGEALLDLRPGQARPLADVDLAELPPRTNVEPLQLGDDLGRLERPAKVAGVDSGERRPGELSGERARLRASLLAER